MSNADYCASCMLMLDDQHDWVHCHACSNKFHYKPCCSLSDDTWKGMSIRNKANWRCAFCKEKLRSTTTNEHVDETNNMFQTAKRQRRETNQSELNLDFEIREIRLLLSDLCERGKMEEENNVKRYQKLEGKISSLINLFEKNEESINKLEDRIKCLEIENSSRIKSLENQLNNMQQINLKKNVEIINLENDKEPIEAVIELGKELDVVIEKKDIKQAFRTRNKKKIIVKFKTLDKKIELINKNKKSKIRNENINIPSTSIRGRKRIFINDELTAKNRKILWLAKQKAKEHKWKYVWIKDGKILVRKDENSSPLQIIEEDDVNQIKQINE